MSQTDDPGRPAYSERRTHQRTNQSQSMDQRERKRKRKRRKEEKKGHSAEDEQTGYKDGVFKVVLFSERMQSVLWVW